MSECNPGTTYKEGEWDIRRHAAATVSINGFVSRLKAAYSLLVYGELKLKLKPDELEIVGDRHAQKEQK